MDSNVEKLKQMVFTATDGCFPEMSFTLINDLVNGFVEKVAATDRDTKVEYHTRHALMAVNQLAISPLSEASQGALRCHLKVLSELNADVLFDVQVVKEDDEEPF